MVRQSSVQSFVAQPALALVGASRSGNKFGNLACRELRSRGYRVYPVHPAAGEIDGAKCYARFEDLPEPVDAVVVSVPPARAVQAIRDAASAGIRQVWLQQGAQSEEAIALAGALGLEVVAGECILMFARPRSYHKAHRWLWGLLGKLPRG
jgi:predicted CoA-binding protein